ncbi:MAG: hypothetical protein EXR69_13200 [Myxococcales bacterium]|nr:hypothetical protein [Myxococcales bacterium]
MTLLLLSFACTGKPETNDRPVDSSDEADTHETADTGDTDYPGAAAVCNGVDDDCDSLVDDSDPDIQGQGLWYADGDTFGFAALSGCAQPAGSVSIDGDCDDADPGAWPGAIVTCDGVDQDCDGLVDDACTTAPRSARAGLWAERSRRAARRRVRVPILGPLPHVSAHVVGATAVGRELPHHTGGVVVRIVERPCDVGRGVRPRVRRVGSASGSGLPLGLGREPVAVEGRGSNPKVDGGSRTSRLLLCAHQTRRHKQDQAGRAGGRQAVHVQQREAGSCERGGAGRGAEQVRDQLAHRGLVPDQQRCGVADTEPEDLVRSAMYDEVCREHRHRFEPAGDDVGRLGGAHVGAVKNDARRPCPPLQQVYVLLQLARA